MCGRYALAWPPSRIRQHLDESNMPSQEAPDDEDVRQSYNFSPGYYGLVYRADVPDHGAAGSSQHQRQLEEEEDGNIQENNEAQTQGAKYEATPPEIHQEHIIGSAEKPQYKLQAMKWGLIPFWTKRNPDFGTLMKTINCRDDSLASSGGMWQTMKQRKRCIVIAQGFFEWLKKNEGKDKIPHYIKRKDGQLMCFAGLWDCVKYEGAENKTYTYTIITTDSNKHISFLHDRMPVIFDNGSEEIFKWLDSSRSAWSAELQALLKPFKGELEIYPVTKTMNKTGTSSPTYIIPIDSAENKQNIANFFGAPKKPANSQVEVTALDKDGSTLENHASDTNAKSSSVANSETNAPFPPTSIKRELDESDEEQNPEDHVSKNIGSPPLKSRKIHGKLTSLSKNSNPISSKRSKSATSNLSVSKMNHNKPGDGNKKIMNFFGK